MPWRKSLLRLAMMMSSTRPPNTLKLPSVSAEPLNVNVSATRSFAPSTTIWTPAATLESTMVRL
ncbi:MAG TPA: hypothetical protein VF652_00100 [Allosphingosinicella sp.]